MLKLQLENNAHLEIVARNPNAKTLSVAAIAFDPKDGYYHCWLAKDGIVAGYSMFELHKRGQATKV
jgi:hypothetical protein